MTRYESDYGRRRTRPGTGNFGPEYLDEFHGGGYPHRRGVWSGAGGPAGYGRDYGDGGYGRDYRTRGYGRDYRDVGYGRDYRTGPHPGPRGFGGGRTAEGYRGPGTDLGEDIRRGYVGRWRDPRQDPYREPARPGRLGRGRW